MERRRAGVPTRSVVEAKDNHHTVGAGMQQALEYAEILECRSPTAPTGTPSSNTTGPSWVVPPLRNAWDVYWAGGFGDIVADPETLPVEEEDSEVPDLPSPLAAFETADGGTLEFFDVGDGYVGVLERSSIGKPHISSGLIEGFKATPLEVYFAVAPPAAEAPKELIDDHNLQRSAGGDGNTSAPRRLAIPVPALFNLPDPRRGDYACGAAWTSDWKRAFRDIMERQAAAYDYETNQPLWKVFYPGGGFNRVTYLGACTKERYFNGGYRLDMMDFEVQRKIGDTWKQILRTKIYGGRKYTFYSAHPSARFRGRIRGLNGESGTRSFGFGVAYSKSLPVAF